MLSLHLCSGDSPRLLNLFAYLKVKGYRFHHLAHCTIGENHCSHAIFISEVKALYCELGHFLNRIGSEDDHVEVTVCSTFCCLEIVRL